MKVAALRRLVLPLMSGVLLTGCTGTYLLDTSVQSFSQLQGVPAPLPYRFERLPSQQLPEPAAQQQAGLEAMADPALHKAGLRRDDANARYSVQVSALTQPTVSPWSSPWDDWGGFGWRRHRYGYGAGTGLAGMESPWYHREVAVIVRELQSNRVVYETRVSNDGPWVGSAGVVPAMFVAAMQGFPDPPAGPRVVNVQVTPPAAAR